TDDLLLRCADDQRTVNWITTHGRFRARLGGPTAGNPLLRRAQHQAYEDPTKRLAIAQRLIAGKIHNCRQLLLRAARDATGQPQSVLRPAAQPHAEPPASTATTTNIDSLLGVEGTAARDYFSTFPALCTAANAPFIRSRRPPTDPLNCLLSFAY